MSTADGLRWQERQLKRTASEIRKHKRALAYAEREHRIYAAMTPKDVNALMRETERAGKAGGLALADV